MKKLFTIVKQWLGLAPTPGKVWTPRRWRNIPPPICPSCGRDCRGRLYPRRPPVIALPPARQPTPVY